MTKRRGRGTRLTTTRGGNAVPDSETLSSRRRFARRQRARRWLAWRRLLAMTAVIAVIAGSVYAVYFSQALAAEVVTVKGATELSQDEVREAAEVPIGRPLARVDLTSVERRVLSLARVRSVEVRRRWPHTVEVTLDERDPVAVVSIGGRLRALDRDGVVFASYRSAPPDLPRIETSLGTGSEALAEVASVVMALPSALRALVDNVAVETIDMISLNLRDGRVVRWGSAERSAEKADVLSALLNQDAGVYDVTVPEQPTISG